MLRVFLPKSPERLAKYTDEEREALRSFLYELQRVQDLEAAELAADVEAYNKAISKPVRMPEGWKPARKRFSTTHF